MADAESKASSAIGESLTKDNITCAYVQKLADGTRVIVVPNG